MRRPLTPCQSCGFLIATRAFSGKHRIPHRCPHGHPCPAGERLNPHCNGPRPPKLGGCPECFARKNPGKRG